MPKFRADKITKMTDDEGNVIVSLVVGGHGKYIAEMVYREIKEAGDFLVEIKKYRANRSLDQNAMLWALATKIALETTGTKTKESVENAYCDLLEEANVESEYLLALPEAEESLRKSFRVVRERGTREFNGKQMTVFQYWLGSSKFDVAQMAELIEVALDRCADLGIVDSETELIRLESKK
jgi:hypothetical protein